MGQMHTDKKKTKKLGILLALANISQKKKDGLKWSVVWKTMD